MPKLLKDYSEFVESINFGGELTPFLAPMGLCGEAGEVMELWKKHLIHGKPLNRQKLIDEMGDVFWYYQLMMNEIGVSLEYILEHNMRKLNGRYPQATD